MGLLSDFFISAGAPPQYDGGEACDPLDKCLLRSLSPLQAAQFLAVLRGQEYSVEMIREFKLVSPEDAEEWTTSVPQEMVDKLAAIEEDQIDEIATQFADATSEELGWAPEDFVPIITGLSALARRAVQTGKAMYLWNCP